MDINLSKFFASYSAKLKQPGNQSTKVGVRALLQRGCRRPLVTRLVAQAAILFFSVVAFALAWFCRRPTSVPPSSGCTDDDIVARTSDESEKSIAVASDAAICSGAQTGSMWRTRLIFAVWRGVWRWTETFELDCSVLGKLIGPVTEHVSWEGCLGRPMRQRYNATCAPVACSVAVEAMNRFVYAASHGEGTPFPWAAAEPHQLLLECQRRRIWDKRTGAYVRAVLEVIQEWGGVPLANPPSDDARAVLPLRSWREHHGLTQRSVAKQLDAGPCVGTLWVCPWYHLFDATRNDAWVYRGCGRCANKREESKRLYGHKAGSHAVVCFGYRRCGDQMHVLVLDNHSPTGPRRWVDVEELDALYTLDVDCLDPPRHASTSGD
ncbi:hypothetical protein ACP70R_042112 [Stipagrostis hirtigluma subsp. patula]